MKLGKKILRKLRKGYGKVQKTTIPQTQMPEGFQGMPMFIPFRQESPLEIKGTLETTSQPKKAKVIEGFEVAEFSPKVKTTKAQTKEESGTIKLTYPLIPREPKKGEPVFSYVDIHWDTKTSSYVYNLVEPAMTEKIKDLMKSMKDLLEQRLDVDFSKLRLMEASDYLNKHIDELLEYFRFKITFAERETLKYYIKRDFIGLGKIEPLMKDSQIEDVSCDGIGIPIFIFHRNPNIGSVITNIVFNEPEELDSFITRLSQLAGKSISVAQPLVDGTLPDGSRLQATLATDIARRGSNFTIRKFTEEPLTPIHLIDYGTVDVKILAYLWLAIDFGRNILVSGGTASGKTSLLNALSLLIKPEKKIISIEDTAELRLPHPHWIPTVARTAISSKEEGGEVDMFQLLAESLRQRPDYIIVGEVRGKEAYILFQQMATGHPSLATIHAENTSKLFDRLTTPPISLPPSLVASLDSVVFLLRMRHKGKFVRRVSEVFELVEFDTATNRPVFNRVFKWNPVNDKFDVENKSLLLKKISDITGISEKDLKEEMERRMLLLNWMKERKVTDYRDIYRVLAIYYSNPNRVVSSIMGGLA